MLRFVLWRSLLAIPTLVAISFVSFVVIELPPGDFLTTYASALEARGAPTQRDELEALRRQYGLDQPFLVRYVRWFEGLVLRGDLGYSFTWQAPVAGLVAERLPMTLLLTSASLLLTWLIALPIGILSAVRKYSALDYIASTIGFFGLAVPNFLIALVLMYVSSRYFGMNVGGLFSPGMESAPWSLAKVLDLLAHLWIPALVIGTSGTAGLIRIVRANLLDELGRPYVETARAKGLPWRTVVLKYPVRLALNPFVSGLGFVLPALFSGEVIVSVVLNLPTTGPLLLDALLAQDMYLAGSLVMLLAVLTVVGVLLSDILLARIDPRIRFA